MNPDSKHIIYESDVEGDETLPTWDEIKFFDGIEQVGNRRSGADDNVSQSTRRYGFY